MLTAVYLLLVCFIGSLIQTVSGFGFGIFVLQFMPFFLPSTQVSVAVSQLCSLAQSGLLAYRLRKHANIRLILPPLLSALVSASAVIFLFTNQPDLLLKRMLAVALILLSVYFLFFSRRIRLKASLPAGIVAGLVSGVLSGLFGMGGPPMVLYLLAATDDNDVYMANIPLFFTFVNAYSSALRAVNGVITPEALKFWALGMVGVLLGVWAGRKFYARIQPETLKKCIYAMMAVSGVILFISG